MNDDRRLTSMCTPRNCLVQKFRQRLLRIDGPEGDRAPGQAADLTEDALGRHGVGGADVLHPVGETGQPVPIGLQHPLMAGDATDRWVAERLDDLSENSLGPDRVGVDQ